LLALGASRKEVYNRCWQDRKLKTQCSATNRSIYDLYSKKELLSWAGHLYKEALKKYHPDLHPENPRLYTEICQELGKAYLRAVKILTRNI